MKLQKKMLFWFVLLGALVSACSLPLNPMTAEERKADLNWAFTIIEHNYAPSEFKKNQWGVDIAELKADCLSRAESEMSNNEFLVLFQECLHSLKDPHVGAQQLNNGILPEYAEVAHLGFTTIRSKIELEGEWVDTLKIVSPLKGSEGAGAPLVRGDVLLSVNGKSIKDYLNSELVPSLDVGQAEANLSAAALRFAVRLSTEVRLPEEDSLQIEVLRGKMRFFIELPWIKEDLLSFQIKQSPEDQGDSINDSETMVVQVPDSIVPLAAHFFGFQQLKDVFSFLDRPLVEVGRRVDLLLRTGFRVMRFNPVIQSMLNGEWDSEQEWQSLLGYRIYPMSVKVTDLMDEPLFNAKMITTDSGDVYAYIQLSSFPAEDKILVEWGRAIRAIEDKQIKSVILDLVDNGGGSLVHGLRILNMLRKKSLQYPSLKLRLNNNWLNSFKSQAAFGNDDYAKSIARSVVRSLEQDQKAGLSLSRPISVKTLDPFFLQNPFIGLNDDVKIALMVNEFCVSMCDIFASVFQENKMGIVIGQQTMGGGGNVVQHGLSPIAKIGISLTESMVLSPQGKVIENFGVTPDVMVDMVADREQGFKKAFEAAYQYIF